MQCIMYVMRFKMFQIISLSLSLSPVSRTPRQQRSSCLHFPRRRLEPTVAETFRSCWWKTDWHLSSRWARKTRQMPCTPRKPFSENMGRTFRPHSTSSGFSWVFQPTSSARPRKTAAPASSWLCSASMPLPPSRPRRTSRENTHLWTSWPQDFSQKLRFCSIWRRTKSNVPMFPIFSNISSLKAWTHLACATKASASLGRAWKCPESWEIRRRHFHGFKS